jgi:hypothetical protein
MKSSSRGIAAADYTARISYIIGLSLPMHSHSLDPDYSEGASNLMVLFDANRL